MADSFWFWNNVSMEQEDIGGGRRGYDIKRGGGRGYDAEIDHQEQEEMMMRRKSNVIRFEDDHHHQNLNTTVSTTAPAKKTKGKLHRKKPEKKTPKRGVGIAKLEETIKQKNAQLPPPADHRRQVHHGYPTTIEEAAASVLPATTYNHQSQSHRYPPFLHHHPQQKQTSTVSSSSIGVHRAANTHLLDLNHDINNNGGYDQIGSASNVNNGGHDHQLMINYHAQQPNVLQQQQKHWNSTTYNVAGYNPSAAGSVVVRNQHGIHNGFYSPPQKVVELSSTQKQQHYHHHFPPQQHSHDQISLNIQQKNLNNGEDIGGFTGYSKSTNINAQITDHSKSADFLQLDLGCKWSNNNVDIKKDSKATAGFLRAGYSGLTNDQVEPLAVHRKGKSSPSSSSSISMEYDFLSLTNGGIKGHHQIPLLYEPHYSSNYSSSSCIMEESAAVRKGSTVSSSQISNSDHHEFLDLSLKLSSYH